MAAACAYNPAMKLHWDIFCSVVDNYGDIGICWRLARELTEEQGQDVRLWVDDLQSFHHIWPEIDPARETQLCRKVEVRRWHQGMPTVRPAEVVVEAFACRVPEPFLIAMADRNPKPVWINLEYFSAEDWVPGCHGLASPHPKLPLTQYFYIPGLGEGTGGVPGGKLELAELDGFRRDDEAVGAFIDRFSARGENALRISLFAYENPAISSLMAALADADQAIDLMVPYGRISAQVAAYFKAGDYKPGGGFRAGSLRVHAMPFLSQSDYDRLLWVSDINFVRGEDSFVRAQHAARPLVWQAYVQDDDVHWSKIDAFFDKYAQGMPAAAAAVLKEAWRAWNAGESGVEVWRNWLTQLPAYRAHAEVWQKHLRTRPGLIDQLVKFVVNKL